MNILLTLAFVIGALAIIGFVFQLVLLAIMGLIELPRRIIINRRARQAKKMFRKMMEEIKQEKMNRDLAYKSAVKSVSKSKKK